MPDSTHTKSPFFSRAYGGFSRQQQEYYLAQIESPRDKVILDPMAGNGYALAQLALDGARVWLGDINPALVSLALFRDPRIIRHHSSLEAHVLEVLRSLKRKKTNEKRFDYVDAWVAPFMEEQLDSYLKLVGIGRLGSPFAYSSAFWTAPAKLRFAASLPVLAAREITCYRMSDNYTWLKKGGVCRESNLYDAMMRALRRWCSFAERLSVTRGNAGNGWGTVSARLMNAEHGCFGGSPAADIIVTSPPYANRLDYTSMWAPELEVLRAMWGGDSNLIKTTQIGSTVIKGKSVVVEEEAHLPNSILEALTAIREDKTEASARYYYPFFRNYALALQRSLIQIGGRLKPGGILVLFVRDTVRKDVMFATSELVRDVFIRCCNMREVDRVRRIHRSHLGLLRKSSTVGLYGLAQREWWLTFKKSVK
jgi:hypothetical protein